MHRVFLVSLVVIAACQDQTRSNDLDGGLDASSFGKTDAGGGDAGNTGGAGGTTGGAGGDTGGSGGGGEDCTSDATCPITAPQCNASGECGRCTSHAACEDREGTTRCDSTPESPKRGQCVECTSEAHCGDDDAPHCVAGSCVECAEHGDCPASKPQCSPEGVCGDCTSGAACEGRAGKEFCETSAASEQLGQCVECTAHTQCDNPEPQCTNNECGPCTNEAACEDRDGTAHCNLREGLETSGQCVRCTGATEDVECGTKSCNQALGACTEIDQESVAICEACNADSECDGNEADQSKCVTHMLGAVNLGAFCFAAYPTANMCANMQPLAKPYSVVLSDGDDPASSIDGHEAFFCLPRTSCEAVDDASDTITNGQTDCVLNTDCGVVDVSDGTCAQEGAGAGKCSYICDEDYECPADLPLCDELLSICVPN